MNDYNGMLWPLSFKILILYILNSQYSNLNIENSLVYINTKIILIIILILIHLNIYYILFFFL